MKILNTFHERTLPVLEIVWVDDSLHFAGLTTLFAADRRKLSLVDSVSFAAMRQTGTAHFFAFDRYFAGQGFVPV